MIDYRNVTDGAHRIYILLFCHFCHIFVFPLLCTYDSYLVYSFGVGSLFASALYSEIALVETEQSYQTLLDESIQYI